MQEFCCFNDWVCSLVLLGLLILCDVGNVEICALVFFHSFPRKKINCHLSIRFSSAQDLDKPLGM